MSEPIDLLTPGRDLWGMVRREPIVLAYDNPWRRFAVVCVVALLFIAAIRLGLGGDRWLLAQLALGVIAAAALLTSARFLTGERRIGALLAEVTTQHVAVGSEVDRIVIPWSAVDTDVVRVPIDSRFMAIPVMKGALDQLIYQSAEATATWDRRPLQLFHRGGEAQCGGLMGRDPLSTERVLREPPQLRIPDDCRAAAGATGGFSGEQRRAHPGSD